MASKLKKQNEPEIYGRNGRILRSLVAFHVGSMRRFVDSKIRGLLFIGTFNISFTTNVSLLQTNYRWIYVICCLAYSIFRLKVNL